MPRIQLMMALAKLGQTVTSAKAGVQKSMKNLDSVFQRNDEDALLQKALMIAFMRELVEQPNYGKE